MARKPKGLARRRADMARMKAKAKKLYPHDSVGYHANHLTACSCHMCGSPRRHFGTKTVNELRNEQKDADQLQDIHENQAA